MGAIVTWVMSFLSGPLLNNVFAVWKQKIAQDTDKDKLAADLTSRALTLDIQERQINAQIIAADNGSWFMRTPRALVQWALALYIAKCIIWDTVLGLGTTPQIGGVIESWFGVIIAFWFGGRTAEKIATIMSNRLKK